MGDRAEPMKVWTNRVPTSLVEDWAARAERESERLGVPVTASGMLRHVMERALASPLPIMPAPEGDTGDECAHRRNALRRLGYATVCGDCGTRVR